MSEAQDTKDTNSDTIVTKISHCNYCQHPISLDARYCENCGNSIRLSERFSDFEVGKISALRDLKTQVFQSLSIFGLIAGGLLTYGLYEGLRAQMVKFVDQKVESNLVEAKSRIDDEERLMRELIWQSRKEFAEEFTVIRQQNNSNMKAFEDSLDRNEAAIKSLVKSRKVAEESLRNFDLILESVSQSFAVEDVVDSFFTIRSLEVYTRLLFDPSIVDRAEIMDRGGYWFQVNLLEDNKALLQFRPNGDSPILIGNDVVAHKHIAYPIYNYKFFGKNMSLLEGVDGVQIKFDRIGETFETHDNSNKNEALIGAEVSIYINGIHIFNASHKIDLIGDELQNLKKSDVITIFWKGSERLLSNIKETYIQSLREGYSNSAEIETGIVQSGADL